MTQPHQPVDHAAAAREALHQLAEHIDHVIDDGTHYTELRRAFATAVDAAATKRVAALQTALHAQLDFDQAVRDETSRRLHLVRDIIEDAKPTSAWHPDLHAILDDIRHTIDGIDTEESLRRWITRPTQAELDQLRARVAELEAAQPETIREAHATLDHLGVLRDGTLTHRINQLAARKDTT